MWWGDLVARSRGLRARPGVGAAPIEGRVEERRREHLAILARRAGGRRRLALRCLFDDADRRTLAVLLRGVAAGVDPERRLRRAPPTPGLPADLLRRLSRAGSVADLGRLLEQAKHPAAAACRGEGGLWDRLLALDRWWAARAVEGARREPVLRDWVADVVDGRNLLAAVALAGEARQDDDPPAGELFLEGGRALEREVFSRAAASGDRADALRRLAAGLRFEDRREARSSRTLATLREGIEDDLPDPQRLEDAVLADALHRQRRWMRRRPLSPAAVIVAWLEQLEDARRLRRAAAEAGLGGAP